MTAKEWLSRGIFLNRQIKEIKEERKKLFALITKSTGEIVDNKVQSSPVDATNERLAAYADYSMEIERRINALIAIKHEILCAIDKVKEPRLKVLLISRYINFKKWDRIADEMNYSMRQIHRLHKRALRIIKDVIECHT